MRFGNMFPTFHPNQLPGVVLRYDAWTGVENSTGVAATDGQTVNKWTDQSGNGLHLNQSDGAKKPLWQYNNGASYVSFDGTDDYMSLTGGSALQLLTKSIYVIARIPATAGGVEPIFSNGTANYYAGANTGNALFASYTNTASTQKTFNGSTAAFSTTAFRAMVFQWDVNGSDVTRRVFQNATQTSTNLQTDGHAAPTTTTWIVGALSSGVLFCNLECVALLVTNTALSVAQQKALNRYYGSRAGVTLW